LLWFAVVVVVDVKIGVVTDVVVAIVVVVQFDAVAAE
jgi:hypothetical protein